MDYLWDSIKGENMFLFDNETYEINTVDGHSLKVDKKSDKIEFNNIYKNRVGKYTERYSKAVFEAWEIMKSAKKSYKPIYLDPTQKAGQSSTYLEFKALKDLYLKPPAKGAIAPWTKKEKAYYESLKTKRERDKYLVIRSGLKSAVIDIPYEAYANVDENGNLINKDYAYLYEKVEQNRGNAHLGDGYLFMGEWELAAGILGDIEGFGDAVQVGNAGFHAKSYAIKLLLLQLGDIEDFAGDPAAFYMLYDSFQYRGMVDGLHKNPLRAMQVQKIAQTIKPDRFGMFPYIDEIMGVDWVIDLNLIFGYDIDMNNSASRAYYDEIRDGRLKDPRDSDYYTSENREYFFKDEFKRTPNYHLDLPNEWSEEEVSLYIERMLLKAKVLALTPPQGYPNAPIYYLQEDLDKMYKEGKLDKKLNPTIPAIYREHFPQYLRDEIEAFAKKHNIRD